MTSGNGGRYPGLIDYTDVTYNNKEYTIGTLMFKDNMIKFVIDKDDFDKIKDKPWHFASGRYISSNIIHDSKKKELYLHNLIMNRLDHPGKGATETVDHINRNGLDNRKDNLRIITQSNQNINQEKKKRSILLPTDFPIKADDIPRHIWYVRANGLHGDRFAIEFKTEKFIWKSTSSKKVSITDKLEMAKDKLKECYLLYPYLNPMNTDYIKERESLEKSFQDIITI